MKQEVNVIILRHSVFICGALLNFLPLVLGYTLKDPSGKYPTFLQDLSNSQLWGSMIASIAVMFPLMLDYFLDILASRKNLYLSENRNIPFKDAILILILPDLIFLGWVLPYGEYDVMAGLIGARDTIYIYLFLSNIIKLKTPVWKWSSTIIIAGAFMSANIFATINSQIANMSSQAKTVCVSFLLVSVSIGFLSLIASVVRWIYYLSKFKVEEASEEENLKNYLCSAYIIAFVIFIFGDWLIFYIPVEQSWSNIGENYLTMYTCLMAFCTMVVTIVTTRVTRHEANESKV